MDQKDKKTKTSPLYLVSGGSGASGEQIIETVLAQFPEVRVPLIKRSHVRQARHIQDVIATASKTGGTVVHTLVDHDLRKALIHFGEKRNVVTIDLMGTLLERLVEVSGHQPVGKPGLYRKLRKEYFDRIASIEFTVAHDDGQRTEDLPSADIVLIGVSRCGKTPLSMYLAVQGWKVANVPFIMEIAPPQELYEIDRNRIIGLSIAYEPLLTHRKKRQERMGLRVPSGYVNHRIVLEELEAARKFFKKGGFHVINVTDKPIESIAEEIIEYLTPRTKKKTVKGAHR